jgi:hypothetical protein
MKSDKMKLRRIHVICHNKEIYSLIKKLLPVTKYSVSCTVGEELNEIFFKKIGTEKIDCLILDKDIDNKFTEKIKEKFKDVSLVYLPSLESEQSANKVIKHMSEPLKLSELSETIESVFNL